GVGLVVADRVLAELQAPGQHGDVGDRQAEHVHVPLDLRPVIKRDLVRARLAPGVVVLGVGLDLQDRDGLPVFEDEAVGVGELVVPLAVGVGAAGGDGVLGVPVGPPAADAVLQVVAAGLGVGRRA